MSLDDLAPAIEDFLRTDKEERQRRKDFDSKWLAARSHDSRLVALMDQAAKLFSAHSEFADSKSKLTGEAGLVLLVSFKAAAGAVTHTLTFEADGRREGILCKSSFGDVTPISLASLEEQAEIAIRNFVLSVLAKLKS